jgi:predicted lipid-binding transport protein (Tim44 family)
MGPNDDPEAIEMQPGDPEQVAPAPPPAPATAPRPAAAAGPSRAAPRDALWWISRAVLAVGSIGFLSGFLGPMVLRPGASAGPMMGIFITGPLGTILGLVTGIVCAALHRARPRAAVAALVAACVVCAGASLLLVLLVD